MTVDVNASFLVTALLGALSDDRVEREGCTRLDDVTIAGLGRQLNIGVSVGIAAGKLGGAGAQRLTVRVDPRLGLGGFLRLGRLFFLGRFGIGLHNRRYIGDEFLGKLLRLLHDRGLRIDRRCRCRIGADAQCQQ